MTPISEDGCPTKNLIIRTGAIFSAGNVAMRNKTRISYAPQKLDSLSVIRASKDTHTDAQRKYGQEHMPRTFGKERTGQLRENIPSWEQRTTREEDDFAADPIVFLHRRSNEVRD